MDFDDVVTLNSGKYHLREEKLRYMISRKWRIDL